MRAPLGPIIAAVLLLPGCSSATDEGSGDPVAPVPAPTTIPGPFLPSTDTPVRDPRTVLSMVPADASALTVTDWDAIRARLGFNDLTSNDTMTERSEFWERAGQSSVLLSRGLLREDNSRLMLDFGFTQDDVDWEARFSGPGGASGYVLAFRPGQDMTQVQAAVEAKVDAVRGARVLPEQRLLVSGVAAQGDRVWAMDPTWLGLTGELGETSYFRQGCVPVTDALGPDATSEDLDALLTQMDPTYFRPLEAFSIEFAGQVATARLGVDRMDLHDRADLAEIWPTTGPVHFAEGFDGLPVADPPTGRIGLRITDPLAAAELTLTETLPFAVCNEVLPIPEPTGL